MGIRALLVSLLLPGIVVLLVLDSWNDYRTLVQVTSDAYDNSLLEPARVLESSVEFAQDLTLRVSAPVYAQVLLESRAGLRKYFRIEEIDPPVMPGGTRVPPQGRTLLGMPDLPRPGIWPMVAGEPYFYDGVYRNDPVRGVAIWRDLYYQGAHRQVLVLVAESTGPRQAAEERAWRQEFLRDGRMVGLVVLLVWVGVALALRPLHRLRKEVRERSPDDLEPLDADRVPIEVAPLVDAVNHHIARYRDMLAEQSDFLADASHQMRTPLAIMLTQAQYALRERDPERMREGLQALIEQLKRTRRLTEQLLTLAHASHDEAAAKQDVDLTALAHAAVLHYLPLAREKRQDLGWQDARAPGLRHANTVLGNADELREALSNLIHNAIHYTPRGARITVSIEADACSVCLVVVDNGPGLAPELRERAFARFERVGAGKDESGSGLGLAIARAYARRNGGDIELGDGEPNDQGSVGLRAILRLPLAKQAAQAATSQTSG
ncbi:sensor histidine kinase [Orrella sp. JC864]|uniref:sensor histidine kinase n=1 Tax=Orrella sp. JC864 TaxID=3120298 RepID=UPI003008B582